MYALRHRGQYAQAVASELDGLLSALRAWLAVDHNEDGTHNLRPSGFDFVPIGTIMIWATDTPPERWIFARGQALSRATHAALFQLWGTTFGAGDGSTTFNAPNLEQRFPMGKAVSGTGSTLGATGGEIDHQHGFSGGTTGAAGGHSHSASTSADGAHSHSQGAHSHALTTVAAADTDGNQAGPSIAGQTSQTDIFNDSGTGSAGSHSHSVSVNNVSDHTHDMGSGSTDTENPPYLVVNYIILAGV